MFARIYAAFFYMLFALTLLAAATPLEVRGGSPPPVTKTITVTAPGPTVTSGGQCNTGPIQCCNSVQAVSYYRLSSIISKSDGIRFSRPALIPFLPFSACLVSFSLTSLPSSVWVALPSPSSVLEETLAAPTRSAARTTLS